MLMAYFLCATHNLLIPTMTDLHLSINFYLDIPPFPRSVFSPFQTQGLEL